MKIFKYFISILLLILTFSFSNAALPANIDNNLKFWLDATTYDGEPNTLFTDTACTTAVVNDGDDVACWTDKASGKNVVQADAASRPSFVASAPIHNNHRTLQFNRSENDHMLSEVLGVDQWSGDYTMFIVFEQTLSGGQYESFFSNGAQNDADHFQINVNIDEDGDNVRDFGWFANGGANQVTSPFESQVQNVLKLYSVRRTSPATGLPKVETFADGFLKGSVDTADGSVFEQYRININRISTNYTTSRITEVIIFEGSLDDAEMAAMNNYLSIKYGKEFGPAPGGVNQNLQLWLKANSGTNTTTNGGAITSWDDVSSTVANITTASGDPTYQANVVNFNPVIRFDQTNSEYLQGDTNITMDEVYAVFLMQPNGTNRKGVVIAPDGASPNGGAIYNFGDIPGTPVGSLYTGYTGSSTASTYGSIPQSEEWSVYSSNATGDNQYRRNGLAENTQAGWTQPHTNMLPIIGARVDNNGVKNAFLNGDIAEIVAYSSTNNSVDENKIESYLALKYGITLDQSTATAYTASTGLKVWDETIDAAYNNDIFGIGNDSGSSLDQRVSKSINTDAIITISTTNDFTSSNQDSGRVSLNDGQFVTIANNNGTATWTNTDTPAMYRILDRKWRYQNTGNVSSMYIKFDVDDPDFDVPNAAGGDYYIVIDTDGDGSFADETPQALDANNSAQINLLSSSTIFTLATQNVVVTVDDVTVNESAGSMTFTLTADKSLAGGFSLDVSTVDGSASAGTDYTAVTAQTVTFTGNAGETQTITVNITDDNILELSESFTLSMSNPSVSIVDVSDTAIGTILDNDTPPVTPGGVGNDMFLWFKANDNGGVNTDGTTLATWTDRSGFGNDAAGEQSPSYQSNILNFNPVVRYEADDKHRLANANVKVQNSTVLSVAIPSAGAGELWVSNGGTTNADVLIYKNGDTANNLVYYDNQPTGADQIRNASKTLLTSTPVLLTVTFDPNNTTSATYALNSDASNAVPNVNTLEGTQMNYEVLGNWTATNFSEPFGDIAETIIYQNYNMSVLDLNKVESYLALKYGITLDQSTPTAYTSSADVKIWDEVVAGSYNNDIFGIGRDDTSALDQRVSKSVNPDAIITISTINDFVSVNEDATRVSLTDGQFVMISNNDGSASYNTSLASPDEYKILDRIWRYQNTGNVSSIYIKFDVDNTNFDIPNPETNYYIILDSDNDGNLNDETPQQLGADNSIQINLNSEGIFTIATELQAPNEGDQTLNPNPPAIITGPGPIVANGTCGADFANGTVEFTTNPAGILNPDPTVANLDASGNYSNVSLNTVNPINSDFEVLITCVTGGGTKGKVITKGIFDANEAPDITSNGGGATALIEINEKTTAVTTVTSVDPNTNDTLVYSISGGADSSKFNINPSTGELTFISAPYYNSPTDSDNNNEYLVEVRVTDSGGLTDTQLITVKIKQKSSGGGRSSTKKSNQVDYVCKDSAALNFSSSGIHKQSLCKYPEKKDPVYVCKDQKALNYDNNKDAVHKQSVCKYENKGDEGDDKNKRNAKTDELLDKKNCPIFTKYYRKGDRGKGVEQIQAFLKTQGLFDYEITGYYGDITDRAVRAFQARYSEKVLAPWGLTKPTGRWYKTTRGMANEIVGCEDKDRIINPEEENKNDPKIDELKKQVKELEEVLKNINEPVTEKKETSLNLNECPIFTKYYRKGDRDEGIRKMQIFLKEQGFFDYPQATGYYGDITDRAVRAFQAKYAEDILRPWGLTRPTGRWYQSTRKKANEVAGCPVGEIRLDNGVILR